MRSALQRLVAFALALGGCGFVDADGRPRIEAHRAGAGNFPENSRTAVEAAFTAGYAGIEVDVGLTSDGLPVLNHGTALDPVLCTTADGAPIDDVRLVDHTFEELRSDYVCGGVPDPLHPDAAVIADSIMQFDEFLDYARLGDSDIVLHLDLQYAPDESADADTFADEVLRRTFDRDILQEVTVSTPYDELIDACEDFARGQGEEVTTARVWPRAGDDVGPFGVGVGELASTLGTTDLVAVARGAGADAVIVAWPAVDRRDVAIAERSGVPVTLGPLAGADLRMAFKWRVGTLMTDTPEDAP